ncbi:hypothetical protein HG530_015042 [Fusarium avenaceum]|nr:hypothetical protein HG530_015042 [Fusarium avenaceum]
MLLEADVERRDVGEISEMREGFHKSLRERVGLIAGVFEVKINMSVYGDCPDEFVEFWGLCNADEVLNRVSKCFKPEALVLPGQGDFIESSRGESQICKTSASEA